MKINSKKSFKSFLLYSNSKNTKTLNSVMQRLISVFMRMPQRKKKMTLTKTAGRMCCGMLTHTQANQYLFLMI
jgi:hypothetical protein